MVDGRVILGTRTKYQAGQAPDQRPPLPPAVRVFYRQLNAWLYHLTLSTLRLHWVAPDLWADQSRGRYGILLVTRQSRPSLPVD